MTLSLLDFERRLVAGLFCTGDSRCFFLGGGKSVTLPMILCQYPQLERAKRSHPLSLLMELSKYFAVGKPSRKDMEADPVVMWAEEKCASKT